VNVRNQSLTHDRPSRREFLLHSTTALAAVPLLGQDLLTSAGDDRRRVPRSVSQYDLATKRELFCRRFIAPDIEGEDPSKWRIVKDAISTVGSWLGKFLDGPRIASIISNMMPLDDRLLPKYDSLVSDCADILHISKPKNVLIGEERIHPGCPHIYVVELSDENILVISSKLIKLYADTQDELRFVVGRELTRIKCHHLRTARIGFAIQALLQTIPLGGWPAAAAGILCPIHLGFFFAWCRESEITADRGGLLCCQNRKLAETALLRQHCDLDDETVRKYGGTFDPDSVMKQFAYWENKPFVDFLQTVKTIDLTCPYVTERMAALRIWDGSGAPQQILSRIHRKDESQHVDIESIKLTGITDPGTTEDVYLLVFNWERKAILRTPTKSGAKDAAWQDLRNPFPCEDGQPIFCEVWSAGMVSYLDSLLGVFVLYPERPAGGEALSLRAKIEWSVNERKSITRIGIAEVKVKFLSS